MRTLIVMILMTLSSTLAHAHEVMPVSMPDPAQVGFESADAAVTAAYVAARTLSTSDESAGAIYQTGDKFFYTLPVTTHESTAIDYKVAKPKGSTMIALYHTHPGYTPGYGGLSTSDCALARDMKLVMYVNVIEEKRILVFNPSKDSMPHVGKAGREDYHGGRQIAL